MKIIIGLGILVVALGAVACDGSETGGTDKGSAASSSSSGGTGGHGGSTSGAGGAGGAGGMASGDPQAPIMTGAEPLAGALHVTWDNVTMDCSSIELDRNKDGGAFAIAYTLTGAATSQHDDQVMAPGMYCYKARCKKGAKVSPDSNEKCGTP